jgi:putative ABC transport system permease protein
MNLAYRDARRRPGRFMATAAGLGLLFAVVISMQGIYAGLVDDATILANAMRADLWIVQRGTSGPFAEASRLDPTLESRAAAVPGVRRARAYTYQLVQRVHEGTTYRLALVGLAWPDDRGGSLPLVAGRALMQAHGEMIVDASLGMPIGTVLSLGGEPFRIVGLTRNALTTGGDAVAFLPIADWQLIANEAPNEATQTERQRALERLRSTDLARTLPGLEDLPLDDRWRAPVLPSPPIHAILLNVDPSRRDQVVGVLERWGDVTVLTHADEEALLLQGVVARARMQLGLFSVILTLTAAVIVMMVLWTMTLEKTHDLAVLRLLGAPTTRLAGLVLQQAWMLGGLAYLIAFGIGQALYPYFPRRVVLTQEILWAAPIAVLLLTTIASVLGVAHATRVDPAEVLDA